MPNIDTEPAGGGLVLTRHLPTGDGQALETVEDMRITSMLRQQT